MKQSLAFQILNGYIAVTALCGMLIFLRYLYVKCELGYRELRPAIALTFFWIGEEILRMPIFYQRMLANAGMESHEPLVAIFIGGLIVETSLLCMIRVFAPEEWGYWSWLSTLILSTFVVALSVLYVFWS